MSISGIQGQLLEVTVVGCYKLKDTEWFSRQDPYVCLEYASTKFRTRTCTDGGKNPVFQEKFVFNLIEGLREITVAVWNSNTVSMDDFIGSGRIQLHDVLSRGYDDRAWSLQSKTGRNAGEVKVILHYANARKQDHSSYASASPYSTMARPQVPMYAAPPPQASYPTPQASYYPPSAGYPASPYSYPHDSTAYAGYPYPPSKGMSAYPPDTYPPPGKDPSAYPPAAYPPPPQDPYAYSSAAYPAPPTAYPSTPYPPPPHTSYPPPGPYSGIYPPPY